MSHILKQYKFKIFSNQECFQIYYNSSFYKVVLNLHSDAGSLPRIFSLSVVWDTLEEMCTSFVMNNGTSYFTNNLVGGQCNSIL